MKRPGPLLEALLRHLSECPSEFIETCQVDHGARQVIAIVCDHFRCFEGGYEMAVRCENALTSSLGDSTASKDKRYRGMLAIATWLLHDDWFLRHPDLVEPAWQWLQSESLRQLSEIVRPEQCLSDPDRREELARLCLAGLDLLPEGELIAQAKDRLTTLDSVERKRVLQKTAAAERRAREVRDAMARKQALESASRYGE